MKIEYDQKADAMYIRLAAGTVAESDEVRPGVVLDFDAAGRVLGLKCWTSASVQTTHERWRSSCWLPESQRYFPRQAKTLDTGAIVKAASAVRRRPLLVPEAEGWGLPPPSKERALSGLV